MCAGWRDEGKDKPWKSRAERLGIDLADADMPEVAGAEWLIGWLFEAGPTSRGDMGIRGLSWLELQAWRELSETWADAWEMRTLHKLSAAYASAYSESEKPHAEAYWGADSVETAIIEKSDQAGATLAAIFGGMSKRSSVGG